MGRYIGKEGECVYEETKVLSFLPGRKQFLEPCWQQYHMKNFYEFYCPFRQAFCFAFLKASGNHFSLSVIKSFSCR